MYSCGFKNRSKIDFCRPTLTGLVLNEKPSLSLSLNTNDLIYFFYPLLLCLISFLSAGLDEFVLLCVIDLVDGVITT